jgi:iron complex outermembrane receptor protein
MQIFTETGEGPPKLGFSMAAAASARRRTGVMASGSSGAVDYLLSAGRFETDGYRDHSAADRDIVNGKFGSRARRRQPTDAGRNSVHLNAQDPLGLTAEQYALNRAARAAVRRSSTPARASTRRRPA